MADITSFKKSVAKMTQAEALPIIILIRNNRNISKPSVVAVSRKTSAKSNKATATEAVQSLIKSVSADTLQKILQELKEGK